MSDEIIKISMTGDIMCKKKLLEKAGSGEGYDFTPCFSAVKPLLSDSDIVIGNLETPVSFSNDSLVKARLSFCAPKEFAEAVYDAGIRYVSTANNHALDRGIKGIDDTIEVLNDLNFVHTGIFNEQDHEDTFFEVKGLRFGMLSYTYGTNAHHNKLYLEEKDEWRVNLFQKQELTNKILRHIFLKRDDSFFYRMVDRVYCLFHPRYIGKSVGERRQPDSFEKERLIKNISKMKEKSPDLMIMCAHIGGQYNEKPTKYTREITKLLRDEGVDIIIGNHEHRIQGCDISELENNKFTTFCLGNFLASAGVVDSPYDKDADYSVLCHLYISAADKKIKKVTFNILKITLNEKGMLITVPAIDLYLSEKDPKKKEELRRAINKAAFQFSGRKEDKEPLGEYTLFDSADI